MAGLAELSITGRIATAADADWDDARQAWNLAADQRPAAVAFPKRADDVSAVPSGGTRFRAADTRGVPGEVPGGRL